jgi:hypothetical protein
MITISLPLLHTVILESPGVIVKGEENYHVEKYSFHYVSSTCFLSNRYAILAVSIWPVIAESSELGSSRFARVEVRIVEKGDLGSTMIAAHHGCPRPL